MAAKTLATAALASSVMVITKAANLDIHKLDLSKYPAATCNDGSAGAYYFRPSPSKSSVWVVHQQGGGWCWDPESCASRPSSLTSSTGWSSTMEVNGLFNSTVPQFADANLVYVPYCTSDGYIGNIGQDDMPPGLGWKYGFRGQQVVRAVFSELATTHGMGAADAPGGPAQVMYGGCSAGARGALFNAETIAGIVSALPSVSSFGLLLDSAFWIDLDPISTSVMPVSFMNQTQQVFGNFNASGGLNPACIAAHPGPDGWKCVFGQYAVALIPPSIRYFLHSYQYDQFQLSNEVGHTPKSPAELAFAEVFRNDTRFYAAADTITPARAGTAAMLPACYKHCNTEGSTWSTLLTNGVSLEQAVAAWFFGSSSFSSQKSNDGGALGADAVPQFIVDDCQGFNCGTGCPKA